MVYRGAPCFEYHSTDEACDVVCNMHGSMSASNCSEVACHQVSHAGKYSTTHKERCMQTRQSLPVCDQPAQLQVQ